MRSESFYFYFMWPLCECVLMLVWCVRVALTCMRLTEQPGGAGSHHAVLGGVEDGLGERDGVSHHGAVEAVLRHDAAAAPAFLTFTPLRSPVLKPHLTDKAGPSVSRRLWLFKLNTKLFC